MEERGVRAMIAAVWLGFGLACSSGTTTHSPGSAGAMSHSGGAGGSGNQQGGGDGGRAGAVAGAGTSAGGSAVGMMPTPYEACIQYMTAQCNRAQRECGGREPLADPCPYATELCPDFLFATGSSYDVESVLACAQTFRTYDCEKLNRGIYPDCVMLPGKHELTEPCSFDNQCASGACGSGDDVAHPRCGQCVPIGKQGDPCDAYGCPNGYECTGEGCQPQVTFNLPEGAPCERYGQCAGDAFCFLAADGTMRCQLPLKLGASCVQGSSCEGEASCVEGKCVAVTPEYAALGEACFGKRCAAGGWCNAAGDASGRCVAQVAVGETCTLDPGLSAHKGGNCNSAELVCHCEGDGCVRRCLKSVQLGGSCGDDLSVCIPGTRCEAGRCVGSASQGLYEAACLE